MRNFRLKKSKKFKKKFIKKSFRKKRKTRKVKKQYKRKRKGTIKYIKKNKRYKKRKTKRNSKKQRGGMVRRRNAAGHSYAIIPENPDAPPPLPVWASRPWWINGFTTSAQVKFINLPVGQQRVHLYGTSLPDQIDGGPPGANGLLRNSRMFRTMGYFMYGKGIRHWVSHQACGDPQSYPGHFTRDVPHGSQCNGNPNVAGSAGAYARAEDNTWIALKNGYQAGDGNVQMHNIYIQDMTCGNIKNWNKLQSFGNFNLINNSSIFHCLAGFGRTGTTLFFYILRNWIRSRTLNIKINCINTIWMGTANSLALYDKLRELMNRSIELDCCHGRNPAYTPPPGDVLPTRVNVGRPVDSHIGNPGPPASRNATGNWESPLPLQPTSDMVHEVFNLLDIRRPGANFCARLFLGRINTIILMIWHYHYITNYPGHITDAQRPINWENIWLYRIPSILGSRKQHTPTTVFNKPENINACNFCKNVTIGRYRGLNTNIQEAGFRSASLIANYIPYHYLTARYGIII